MADEGAAAGEGAIRLERTVEGVALVRIHRPETLNSLSSKVMRELNDVLGALDVDEQARCIVLTGTERAFASGADIEEMRDVTAIDMYVRNHLELWDAVRFVKTPIVAAVSGWCLGGGLELAMSCDIVVASEDARFGQPEINIGVIPGAGGTQRLPRGVGKSLAMEMVLTGKPITAVRAERLGLVSRVVPKETLLDEAVAVAADIAAKPPLAVRAAKDAILKSFDTPIEAGLAYERNIFFLLFASDDQREGMAAFTEKRKPTWKGR